MLQEFEGKEVVRATVKLTGAGDGLSEPMKIDPVEFHHGDLLYVLCEAVVVDVGYKATTKTDPGGSQVRVHTARAGSMTIVPSTLAVPLIEEQRLAILVAREAAAGIEPLPFDPEDLDVPPDADPAVEG